MESATYVTYGIASLAALALIPLALAELFPEDEPEVETPVETPGQVIDEDEPVAEEASLGGDGTPEAEQVSGMRRA